MIWTICGILTVLFLALSCKASLNKKRGSVRVVFGLIYLCAATYTCYIPIFAQSYDFVSGLVGNLVHVLQVATIDSGLIEYYDLIRDGIGIPALTTMYIILLGVVHIAMPSVSALTAVTVLFRCFSSVQVFLVNLWRKPVFVFSEVNERSLQLARSLIGIKCDIIFAGSTEEAMGNEDDSQPGLIFKDERISELHLRCSKRKDVYFFCISENEDDSLTGALQLMEKYGHLKEEVQEHVHIYHFSQHQDFSVFIDSADKGALDIQCVNEYETMVYNLLNRYPLFSTAKKNIHVLLHGLSPLNVVALRAIAWCGQLSGYTTRISVVGIDIANAINDLKVSAPRLFSDRYHIRFYDCANEKEILDTIARDCADANYIVISEGSDNDTMNRGILLRRLFYQLDPTFTNCPPIFCHIKESSKSRLVGQLTTSETNPVRKVSYDLIPFGSLAEVYSYKNLVDNDLDKLAKNVHLAYEEVFSDGPINVKEALKRFHVFEVNKRSNRAAALHIRYKLNRMGLDYTDDASRPSLNMADYYNEEYIAALVRSEHDRWMAFLESEGWTPSTGEQVNAYRASDISKGRHNCPLLKMHPYIRAYDSLKELSVELEGKDTTVYDEALVLKIPDILGDKWKVAGKQYPIIKR